MGCKCGKKKTVVMTAAEAEEQRRQTELELRVAQETARASSGELQRSR